ncbi:c-type cytochrome [Sulfurovum sp. NBC37-1]|uniref:c-type cytochrome n=1 Tax=Sulfurovum sp. (strain NBC37-1) TaxID=387093 RepID=UPI0001587B39|nr:c-type cytochrome [Sulfurovum sp. NBC37-1]BAF72794.1 cytochrome c, class I [Sulfurovum sp. NBC37-1]
MKKKILLVLLSNLLLNAETISEVYLKNGCHGCHGLFGEGIGASPRLQGRREEVLLKRLKDLQNGKTRTAFGNVMISFAKNLDRNQTAKMAKYLSTLKRTEQDEVYELDYDDNAGDGSS